MLARDGGDTTRHFDLCTAENAKVTLCTLAPILSFLATISGVKSFLLMAASQYAVAATVVVATPAILPQRWRARAKWAILQPGVWMGSGLVVSEGMRNSWCSGCGTS